MALRSMTIVATLLCVPHTAGAAIVGLFDVTSLVNRSNLVVVGAVRNVSYSDTGMISLNGNMIRGRNGLVAMDVDVVLKGTLSQTQLSCSVPVPDPDTLPFQVGAYRMSFLSIDDHGGCRFTDPHHLSTPAVPVNRPNDTEPLQRVTTVLIATFESGAIADADKIDIVQTLGWVDLPMATASLRRAYATNSLGVRRAAAIALLQHNDLQGIGTVEDILTGANSSGREQTMARIAISRLSTESAVPTLVRLAKSPIGPTRQVAMDALRKSKSEAAIPALVQALDDSDAQVQYTAVAALYEICGQGAHLPTIDAFRQDPAQHLSMVRRLAQARAAR